MLQSVISLHPISISTHFIRSYLGILKETYYANFQVHNFIFAQKNTILSVSSAAALYSPSVWNTVLARLFKTILKNTQSPPIGYLTYVWARNSSRLCHVDIF